MIKLLFDSETTGLLKPDAVNVDEQPEIVELYCIKLDEEYQILGEYHSYYRPKTPVTEELTKIHGITNEKLKDAPTFEEQYKTLSAFFTGVDELIAHNLAFDRSMLANELIRIDKLIQFPWPRKHTCTVEMSMPIEQRRLGLKKLHVYATGKEHEGQHRAKDDVFALVRCYHWLMEKDSEQT